MTPLRVLIVDDDELTRELVSRALSSDRFEVASAIDATAIPNATSSFVPDIVLADVNIPGVAPGETVAVVRSLLPAGTRVVLFSASDDAELRRLAKRVQADGWLSKGTSILDLGARILALLNR